MSALALYAASVKFSYGRVYDEDEPDLRDQFQRDRDRIIHSSAFRRLEYKTQVFVNHEGDMFRTRLTHSIEVSQIGRTIARALCINEDLTEAICLAHDLGHTPFGHAGQDALNKCMQTYGGFEHNLQSLRVVDLLEERYADFPGLNLMFETREGILKHCSRNNAMKLGKIGKRFLEGRQAGLEAQVANIADEIAYNNHDVDDGFRAGLLSIKDLNDCELFKDHYDIVINKWPDIEGRRLINELIRRMINNLVTDLVETTLENINSIKLENINDVRSLNQSIATLSEKMQEKNIELKRFLRNKLYNHYHVKRMSYKANGIITTLFEAFTKEINLLPHDVQEKINGDDSNNSQGDKNRMVADYIAGMTDRFAISEYERITDPRVNTY